MHKHPKTQNIVDQLCQKVHCSELADDLERINQAREGLAKLQQTEVFKNLYATTKNISKSHVRVSQEIANVLFATKQRLEAAQPSFITIDGIRSEESTPTTIGDNEFLREVQPEMEESLESEFSVADDAWLGFFRGYEILEGNQQERIFNANKQCLQLSLNDDNGFLEKCLRGGIRCFMIDLFIGTELEKQKMIFRLQESELKVSREYGFPISTTLFAMLSPRLQYTGIMDAGNPTRELKKGDNIVLTTKTKYSSRSGPNKVYVNALFLLEDCRKDDFILVGPSIQLCITETLEEELKCVVVEPGELRSRLPVLFPARCHRLELSLEELESITFAREVGINVLVSYKPGNQQYLEGLKEALILLRYDNARIFSRLVLNEYESEDSDKFEWIANNYDGFLVDFSEQQYTKCCRQRRDQATKETNNLSLSTACLNFITKVYNMKKPIILNPCLMAAGQLVVPNSYIYPLFYYPDKFIFSRDNYGNAFSFYHWQNSLAENIFLKELCKPLFCVQTDTGNDTIARACVAAAFECKAKAIVVCSACPATSIKLSHFRPNIPIMLVSAENSIGDYISLYHNLNFMNFHSSDEGLHADYVRKAFILCMIFLETRNILNDGENALLVYGTEATNQMCDRYLLYKFVGKHFAKNLQDILFV